MLTDTSEQFSFLGEVCPCGKSSMAELERVPRGLMVKIFLFWLPLKKYKCYKCLRNKWVLDKKEPEQNSAKVGGLKRA